MKPVNEEKNEKEVITWGWSILLHMIDVLLRLGFPVYQENVEVHQLSL